MKHFSLKLAESTFFNLDFNLITGQRHFSKGCPVMDYPIKFAHFHKTYNIDLYTLNNLQNNHVKQFDHVMNFSILRIPRIVFSATEGFCETANVNTHSDVG